MLDGLSIGKEWLQRLDNTRRSMSKQRLGLMWCAEDDIETEIVSRGQVGKDVKFAEGQDMTGDVKYRFVELWSVKWHITK